MDMMTLINYLLPHIGMTCRGNGTEAASKCTLRPSCSLLEVERCLSKYVMNGCEIFDLKSRRRELVRTYSARGVGENFSPCAFI